MPVFEKKPKKRAADPLDEVVPFVPDPIAVEPEAPLPAGVCHVCGSEHAGTCTTCGTVHS